MAPGAAMTSALIGWLVARPWALRLARTAAIASAVLLFLLAVRRSGERAGRSVSNSWRKTMTHKERCSRQRRVALLLAKIWLSGCATGASDPVSLGACPPVVQYIRVFQGRAAEELASL